MVASHVGCGRPHPTCFRLSDQFDSVAVRIAAEEGLAAGAAEGVGNVGLVQTRAHLFEVVHQQGGVPVAATVVGAAHGRVGVWQLQQMDLLLADVEPGAGKAEVGPLRVNFQSQ